LATLIKKQEYILYEDRLAQIQERSTKCEYSLDKVNAEYGAVIDLVLSYVTDQAITWHEYVRGLSSISTNYNGLLAQSVLVSLYDKKNAADTKYGTTAMKFVALGQCELAALQRYYLNSPTIVWGFRAIQPLYRGNVFNCDIFASRYLSGICVDIFGGDRMKLAGVD
jgi:hypothetical protein